MAVVFREQDTGGTCSIILLGELKEKCNAIGTMGKQLWTLYSGFRGPQRRHFFFPQQTNIGFLLPTHGRRDKKA